MWLSTLAQYATHDEPEWAPRLQTVAIQEGARLTRTQSPIVAGFAFAPHKAQGLTIKEGAALHLAGRARLRPAPKHAFPLCRLQTLRELRHGGLQQLAATV